MYRGGKGGGEKGGGAGVQHLGLLFANMQQLRFDNANRALKNSQKHGAIEKNTEK